MVAATGSLNARACAFYAREGFTTSGRREVGQGVFVTLFEKRLSRTPTA